MKKRRAVWRWSVAVSSAEEWRQDSIAKEGVAHHNYQMSRFLLCYLVYSFLHACFLLGRFIFLGQDKQDGQKDLRSSQRSSYPCFIFHIAPRVMNNSGYMFCLVFQEAPFVSRGPPFVFIQFPTLSRLFSIELPLS